MEEVTVIAERDIAVTKPHAEVLRKGRIYVMDAASAETLIGFGDVRAYGGPSEDKSLPGPTVNKNAKKFAEEYGVELSSIEGTGRGGRIIKEDVEGYVESLGLEKIED